MEFHIPEYEEDDKFWKIVQKGANKGEYKILLTRLYKFLNKNGFHLAKQNNQYLMVRIIENVIEECLDTDVSQFLLRYIRSLEGVVESTEDLEEGYRNNTSRVFSPSQLKAMEAIQLDFLTDDKENCYIYYENCWVQIDQLEVKSVDYPKLPGQVWKSSKHKRPLKFRKVDLETLKSKGDFAQFIWKVSGQKDDRFNSLRSIIGYLLHGYKNPSLNKAVILCDEQISDNPNGGTGKGIFIKGISEIRNTAMMDGKNFTFKSRFAFQHVSRDTELLVFDDVLEDFNMERLFSVLTNGISIEKKGKQQFYIEYKDSPKVAISTNNVLHGEGNSFSRRKTEFEFAQHYQGNIHSPFDEFKHNLFEDWDEKQWQWFDLFMIDCIQYFLQHGLIEASPINLDSKRLVKATCPEFVEYMEGVRRNHEFDLKILMSHFEDEYQNIRRTYRHLNRYFPKWLRIWEEVNPNIKMETRKPRNQTKVTFREIDLKEVTSEEMS